MHKALPEFDLDKYLPYRMSVLAARISDELAKHYKREHGLSVPEWRVLMNVGYSDSPSIRDIERRVSLEKSKVSRAAARLEAKGYLKKETDAEDRRLLKLALTDQGAVMLAKLVPVATAFQEQLSGALGEHEMALWRGLDLLTETLNDRD